MFARFFLVPAWSGYWCHLFAKDRGRNKSHFRLRMLCPQTWSASAFPPPAHPRKPIPSAKGPAGLHQWVSPSPTLSGAVMSLEQGHCQEIALLSNSQQSSHTEPPDTSLSLGKSAGKSHVHSTSPLPPVPHMSCSHARRLHFCAAACPSPGGDRAPDTGPPPGLDLGESI